MRETIVFVKLNLYFYVSKLNLFCNYLFMSFKFNLRTISQVSVVTLILVLAFLHQKFWIEKAAPVDAYCPFGWVETFFKTVFEWWFLTRTFYSNFILLIIFILMTLVFWRVFCWYFCPLWAIQEWLRSLWKKLWIKKDFEFPKIVDKYLRYFKYIVLIAVVYFSISLGELAFRYYDPFVAFSHLWNEFEEIIWAYVILWIIVLWSLFTKSFWCRYTCPLWAFFWIFKKISLFKLDKNEKTCTKCMACNRACPVWLDFNDMKQVNSAECLSCLDCVKSCNFSSLETRIWKWKISRKKYQYSVVFGYLAIMLLVVFMPFWQSKPISNLVWPDWKINTEDLRWSNTLEFVIRETKIPFSYFKEKLKLPDNVDKNSKLKHIWEDYNIKNASWEFIEMEDFKKAIDEYHK